MPPSARYASIVFPWLWWATFEVRRRTGSGVLAAYRAAFAATARY